MNLALEILKAGGIVGYPTETFYGLGVDAFNEKALLQLSKLKGRPAGMPFPVLAPSIEMIQKYVVEIPLLAEKFMNQFWPGALTLILKAPRFPKLLQGEHQGIGFRISKNILAQELVSKFGTFITTTSANLSSQPPAQTALEVHQYFPDIHVIDGGKTKGEKPSTVLDFTKGTQPVIVREGLISKIELGLS